MKVGGFCDLNICIQTQKFDSRCRDHLLTFGYKTIALNTIMGEESSEGANTHKKKKKNQDTQNIPVPYKFPDVTDGDKKLQILQRLTVYFSEASQLQKLTKSEVAKKYDIISVIPKNASAFQLACACKDIDMISFDPGEQVMRLTRKMYNQAVSNGIHFEITYAPAIIDSGKRRVIIQTAHLYHTYGKSKKVVITSGAADVARVRGPYDAINLGLLFGLSEEQAKFAMLKASQALIRRAEGRRFGKTAVTLMISDPELDSESEEEMSENEPVTKKSKINSDSESDMSVTGS